MKNITNTDNTEKENKTNWHRLWGLMVAPLFERLKCEVTVEFDLSLKAQRLDMVVVTKLEDEPINFDDVNIDYYQGFENLNVHNLISFKSFNESFNQTAIEEFYGHFTNYKKMRNLENQSEKINLYAVTHHLPEKLFSRYKNTDFLECVTENRIYDFKVFTPVRFIVTNNFDHPILGLFSNKTEQIAKSTERLKQDGWLLKKVSSYINELYNYYSLEGVNMPYTREIFLKEHYPDIYEHFMLGQQEGLQKGEQKGIQKGEQKGRQEGRQEGELIGKIQLLQQILKQTVSIKAELLAKNISELQSLYDSLEKEWLKVQN